MIQAREVIKIDIEMNDQETLTAMRKLSQGLENLNNEVIKIDIEMNDQETLTAMRDLSQGLEDLNNVALDVSRAINQTSDTMQDSEISMSLVETGANTLTSVLGILDIKLVDIVGKTEKWNRLTKGSTEILTFFKAGINTSTAALTAKTTATTLATGATKLLTVAMNALPIFAVMAGIQLLIGAIQAAVGWFTNWRKGTKEVSEETEQLCERTERLDGDLERLQNSVSKTTEATAESSRAFDENMRAIDNNSESIQNQMDQLSELANQDKLSAEEKVKMNHIIDQLNGSVEGLNLAYDEETGKLNMSSEAMEDKVKAYLDINDEIGKMQIAQERMNELTEEGIIISKGIDDVILAQERLTEEFKAGVITQEEYDERIQLLNTSLSELEQEQRDNTDAQLESSEAIVQAQENIAQATEDGVARQMIAFESLNDTQQGVIGEMKSTLSDYTDHASNMMSTLSDDIEVTGEEMIANMKKNQEVMETWSENIVDLAERGLDKGLIEELRKAGPESAAQVAALVEMSEAELKEMNEVYRNSSEVATSTMSNTLGEGYAEVIELAARFMQENKTTLEQEIKAANFDKVGLSISDGLSKGIEEGQDDVNKATADTIDGAAEACEEAAEIRSPSKVFIRIANNLMKGLLKGIQDDRPKVTKELSEMKPDFDKAGRDAMDGLNAGLNARRSTVLNTARSIANEVTRTIRSALDINSPSRVMRDQVGKFIPEGIAVGIDAESGTVMDAMQNISDDMIKIPKISPESLVESSRGGLFTPSSSTQSATTNNHHTHNEGLFNGATIIWKGKEDIRQTMQEIAWITQTEGARM